MFGTSDVEGEDIEEEEDDDDVEEEGEVEEVSEDKVDSILCNEAILIPDLKFPSTISYNKVLCFS